MIDLGLDLLFWCILYVVLLIVIGTMGRRARQESSLSDLFLAGRTFGPWLLLFTFFATQYSGNSLSGFPGQTYREGIAYFMSVTFMVGVVYGYTLFAPRLYALSRRRGYITPTDYLNDRYGSAAINALATVIFAWALLNFLLAQLMALGHAFSAFTQGQIPYWGAVVGGAVVVLGYVLLGGMRAVAWTDVVQGLLLALGLVFFGLLLWSEVGSPRAVLRTVQLLRPELVANPPLTVCLVWISNFLLLTLGAPLYPQAIQRVFAARGLAPLRRSLAVLAVVPLFVGITVVFVGAAGIALFPQLDQLESEQVTFRVISYLVEGNTLAYYPALFIMLAVVSAIMSTADACLLSLSSIFAKDVVARARGLEGEAADTATRWVPAFMIVTMAVVALIALQPRMTLWGLLVIKFEILIQLSPAFVLGTLHDRGDRRGIDASDVLRGLGTGLGTIAILYLVRPDTFGLHFGTVGAMVNYATVFASAAVRQRRHRAEPADAEARAA